MTKITYEKLEQKKIELEEKLQILTQEVATARERGDLRENAEYSAAKDADFRNREEYNKTIEKLRYATVIDLNSIELKDYIVFGCTVVLIDEINNKEVIYTILGEEEANIFENKISCNSPLGRNLLGKKQNESFSFDTPNGKKTFTIKNFYINS